MIEMTGTTSHEHHSTKNVIEMIRVREATAAEGFVYYVLGERRIPTFSGVE